MVDSRGSKVSSPVSSAGVMGHPVDRIGVNSMGSPVNMMMGHPHSPTAHQSPGGMSDGGQPGEGHSGE